MLVREWSALLYAVNFSLIYTRKKVECHPFMILPHYVSGQRSFPETGVAMKATQTVMTRIWRRVSKMPSERNKLRAGGRQVREYMEREWSLPLEDGEVQSNAEIELEEMVYELDKENRKLQKEVKKAKCKEQKAQDKIV